jgi:hypothetical protein
MRALVEVSQYIRKIEFTEAVKRRLIEEMKDAVESVRVVQREVDALDRILNPKNKKSKLKEEEKKNLPAPDQGAQAQDQGRSPTPSSSRPDELKQTLDVILRGEYQAGAGEEGAGRSQPAPRRVDREEVHQPRAAVPRPDSRKATSA